MNEATTTVPRARIEIKPTAAVEARFWSKVNKDGPTIPHMESPCWVWLASKDNYGYGRMGIADKILKTHRLAWTFTNGQIPHDSRNLCVCHRCDNPSCVNPSHLFLGSHTDNMRDMTAKGRNGSHTKPERRARGDRNGARLHPERMPRGDRHGVRLHPECVYWGDNHHSRIHPERMARGESNGLAKLTDAKVIDIRDQYAAGGVTHKQLAAKFGVDRSIIGDVVNRKTWRHIP